MGQKQKISNGFDSDSYLRIEFMLKKYNFQITATVFFDFNTSSSVTMCPNKIRLSIAAEFSSKTMKAKGASMNTKSPFSTLLLITEPKARFALVVCRQVNDWGLFPFALKERLFSQMGKNICTYFSSSILFNFVSMQLSK